MNSNFFKKILSGQFVRAHVELFDQKNHRPKISGRNFFKRLLLLSIRVTALGRDNAKVFGFRGMDYKCGEEISLHHYKHLYALCVRMSYLQVDRRLKFYPKILISIFVSSRDAGSGTASIRMAGRIRICMDVCRTGSCFNKSFGPIVLDINLIKFYLNPYNLFVFTFSFEIILIFLYHLGVAHSWLWRKYLMTFSNSAALPRRTGIIKKTRSDPDPQTITVY